ncbi:MAG: ribonuclease P protein component [Eubacterium sp.]|nr:ribonuclease P protein component [Eubacterium sp.]
MQEGLKKNSEFSRVYETGKSVACRDLVLYKKENDLPYNRLGISVSKKVGNSVVRHRVKRLIRESYRLNREIIEKGYDLVVIARPNAKGEGYDQICKSLLYLCKKHGLMRKSGEV